MYSISHFALSFRKHRDGNIDYALNVSTYQVHSSKTLESVHYSLFILYIEIFPKNVEVLSGSSYMPEPSVSTESGNRVQKMAVQTGTWQNLNIVSNVYYIAAVWRPLGNIHKHNYLNKAKVQKQFVASSLWTLACWHHCAVTVHYIVLYRDFPCCQL